MHIQHHGQESVSANIAAVWDFIGDAKKVSQCLPDVQHIDIKDDKRFAAHIGVNMGPLRGTLEFLVTLEPHQEQNKMMVRMQGGGPGITINLSANTDVIKQASNMTLLNWKGQAEIRGPATLMGGKMLEGKAKDIIAHVFKEIAKNINTNLA